MENDSAFRPGGPTVLITGSVAPGPTPVQIGGPSGGEITVLTWNQGANGAFLIYGATQATCAAAAAALPTAVGVNCIPLPSTPNMLPKAYTLGPNQWYTVITLAATSNVYLTAGNGR